jgi:hypothetical protein
VCSLSEYSELKGHVAPNRVEVAVSSKKNGAGVVGGQSSNVDLLEGGVERECAGKQQNMNARIKVI